MEGLKNRLKEISAGRILDVGIGRGQFAWIMAESFKEYDEIVGIDVDSKILGRAQKNLSQFKVRLQVMDGTELQFGDNSFDTVAIAQVLHHIPSKQHIKKIFMEMWRVLRPGGLFIVKEMFSDHHQEAGQAVVDFHHLIADIDRILGRNHFRTFKKNEIVEMVSVIKLEAVDEFEFMFDERINKDEKDIKEFSERIDKWFESIRDYDEYDEIKRRAEDIKARVEKLGLSYEREVVIMGRKPLLHKVH